MPFLKGNDKEAARIHENYQKTNDQKAFLRAARDFLRGGSTASSSTSNNSIQHSEAINRPTSIPSNPFSDPTPTAESAAVQVNQSPAEFVTPSGVAPPNKEDSAIDMSSIERGLGELISDEPVVSISGTSIWGSSSSASGAGSSSAWPLSSAIDQAISTKQTLLEEAITPKKQDPPSTKIQSESKAKKEIPQPKRLWCHFEEQPGRLFVNGCSGENPNMSLYFGPRDEMTAQWIIPINYLREYASSKAMSSETSLDQLLSGLVVGLFRRGCTENGSQASIISKSVTGDHNRSFKFWKDASTGTIRGEVPFFSPRTPGCVLFRLYWENDPLYTLAMGPAILVRSEERDFESSIRFVLSNFKGKKANPTSLSSLNSLAAILETPLTRPNESASRAAWGCIQEARKVIEACADEYLKTSERLLILEGEVEHLKKQVEEEDTRSGDNSYPESDGQSHDKTEEATTPSDKLREKLRSLMSGRASCERKWRDSQLSFAGILKAIVTNRSISVLLRREMLVKLRLEYELWCPLCEEFAKLSDDHHVWYEPIRKLPASVTGAHFAAFAEARTKMQISNLGFDPNTVELGDILYLTDKSTGGKSVNTGAVSVFNNLSTAMGQYFQDVFVNENEVGQKRELIRQKTEAIVESCKAFPVGTKVAVFGSSANGFGSPNSDIDMCLQIPGSMSLSEDAGSEAMAKLAEKLGESGMEDVDISRLNARIPIIMYHCPDPLSTNSSSAEALECDLSMQNPLAVLNTSLLRAYAEITPVTRVLACIIKRWAKARDINSPARHTLSSYGYIIMLLHFLTIHERSGNGLVSRRPTGDAASRSTSLPLLPNLQWMDPRWLASPQTIPYSEMTRRPQTVIQHPREDDKKVNTYFFRPQSTQERSVTRMAFAGQDLSLAILLASFFRYYAYEFDYKKFVVSLHSTSTNGMVEREVKAELDGWRNYSAALTIEDPFETFYDIAHVLRGGYYHRIRREFTMAYSKLADVTSGKASSCGKDNLQAMTGGEILDWLCEPLTNEKESSLD